MSKIEIGQRVWVNHKPEHDSKHVNGDDAMSRSRARLHCCTAEVKWRSVPGVSWWVAADGIEAVFESDELTPIEAALPEPSEPVKVITRAAEGLDRDLRELREADKTRLEALHSWRNRATKAEERVASLELRAKAAEVEAAAARASADAALEAVDKARDESKLIRADIEALQAAVMGLTGIDGDVADMVKDIAELGAEIEVLNSRMGGVPGVASAVVVLRNAAMAIKDRPDTTADLAREQSCHRGTKEALTKLRAKHEDARREFAKLRAAAQRERSWASELTEWSTVERAFADEPTKDPEPVAGPWVEIEPGEWRRRVDGSRRLFAMGIGVGSGGTGLIWMVEKPHVGGLAERGIALGGTDEERLRAAMAACDAAARRVGWTLRDAPKVEPIDVERKIALLNTAVENLARHAEDLERRLSEVQDPAWFAARFREHVTPQPVAEARPRVSWQWSESGSYGWLCTADTRVAGAHEGNDGWYWWVRSVNEEMPRRVGPVSKEEAIAKAEAATRQWADIMPSKS